MALVLCQTKRGAAGARQNSRVGLRARGDRARGMGALRRPRVPRACVRVARTVGGYRSGRPVTVMAVPVSIDDPHRVVALAQAGRGQGQEAAVVSRCRRSTVDFEPVDPELDSGARTFASLRWSRRTVRTARRPRGGGGGSTGADDLGPRALHTQDRLRPWLAFFNHSCYPAFGATMMVTARRPIVPGDRLVPRGLKRCF